MARTGAQPRAAESQKAWEWSIAGYLYLGGLGAGSFTVALVAGWLGFALAPARFTLIGDSAWEWPKALILWGPFATALGASLLIFHLGRNRLSFYNAHKNPRTSWLARGFIILGGFIVSGCVVAVVSIFFPAWPLRAPIVWRALEGTAVVFAVCTAVYTGLLLRSMKYIPAWNAPFIPFLFLASALSTGTMGVILGALMYRFSPVEPATHRLVRGLERVELLLIVIEATLLALYVRYLKSGRPAGLVSARMWLSGPWRYGFWGGIVAPALALPLAIDVINLGMSSDALAIIASVSVLIGGFALRLGVLEIGVKEEPPLYKLAIWRAQLPPIATGREQKRP